MPYIWLVGLIYLGLNDEIILSYVWCVSFVMMYIAWVEILKPILTTSISLIFGNYSPSQIELMTYYLWHTKNK